MTEDPFAEPHDDRTVIRPQPGGRRMAPPVPAAARPVAPAPAAPPLPAEDWAAFAGAAGPLAAAAAPLLQLLARLRATATPPVPGDLRKRVVDALREFTRQANTAGVPPEQSRATHLALSASLDDAIGNTPWGRAAGWLDNPLMTTHRDPRFPDADGDSRFMEQLARLRRAPAEWLPVLEVMYLCLSLGYVGRARGAADPAAELERLREQTHAAIAHHRRGHAAELSPQWAGVAAPYVRRRAGLPIWVASSAALVVLVAVFAWTALGVSAASDGVYAGMASAAPAGMPRIVRAAAVVPPPTPGPPPPGPADTLRAALRADIAAGHVILADSGGNVMLRLDDRLLFAASGATPLPAAGPLLSRVGAALGQALGGRPAFVLGYSDTTPIRTLKFPSNFELSSARATAVRDALAAAGGGQLSLTAEGRGEADPIDSNATADGRARNRRVDIVVRQGA
jgi:type VI secretion system protein ImpK